MRTSRTLWLGAFCIVTLSCGGGSQDEPRRQNQDPESNALISRDNYTYYTMRSDTRRCAAPLCGGYFAKRVNTKSTVCEDGSRQEECYVAELNLRTLGLDSRDSGEVQARPEQFLVRGTIVAKIYDGIGDLGSLHVQEVWRGQQGRVPSGTFYRVKDTGIVCFAYPCLSYTSEELNSPQPLEKIAGINLDGVTGPTTTAKKQLGRVEGLLAAATTTTVTGAGGTATLLMATEYYLPLQGKAQVQSCGAAWFRPCSAQQFCNYAPGSGCGRADVPGLCMLRPTICTEQYQPVCGCDGKSYGNPCTAAALGVSVDHRGLCALRV